MNKAQLLFILTTLYIATVISLTALAFTLDSITLGWTVISMLVLGSIPFCLFVLPRLPTIIREIWKALDEDSPS